MKIDTSVYAPRRDWDGACWIDVDGTIIPVERCARHFDLVLKLREETGDNTLFSDDLYAAGLVHVGASILANCKPTELQIDAILWVGYEHEMVLKAIRDGVKSWKDWSVIHELVN